jgi:DNA replication protein DnaC
MSFHDTDLAAAAVRICADRGIAPADYRETEPLTRREFYRRQIGERIRHRWAGMYDGAQPTGLVAAWIRRHLAEPGREHSLFVAGSTGTGKTHNAVAVLHAIGLDRAEQGRGLLWAAVSHPDLAHQLRPKSDDSHEHALDRYLDAELLILDDLGAGLTREWGTDWLQRLVDHRWTRRAATVYTTNLPAQPLRAAVGDRVYSRLGDATRIQLGGDDRRWAQ